MVLNFNGLKYYNKIRLLSLDGEIRGFDISCFDDCPVIFSGLNEMFALIRRPILAHFGIETYM
jgi:hypothetical protein